MSTHSWLEPFEEEKYPAVTRFKRQRQICTRRWRLERDRKIVSKSSPCTHAKKRCASLAMRRTTSLVLRCNNKHYSRLMLIGIALFRLHARGEKSMNVGRWRITRVHRCGTVSVSQVPVNSASVAHASSSRLALVWTTDTLQPGSACMRFGIGSVWLLH